MDETYLSAQRAQEGEDPRVPQADVDQGRPGGDPVAPGEGTPSPVGVIGGAGPAPIRSRGTFEALRRSRHRGRSGPVSVVYVPQRGWSRCEVAYAINRQVGNAVTRNRLRRRLRSILSERAAALPTGAYLVRTEPDASQLGFYELKVAMRRALEQAVRRAGDVPVIDGALASGAVG
jgi:ribonuclease P protein component